MSEQFNGEPWTIRPEILLKRKQPDVLLITLLTDEAGAFLIAQGKVPGYVQQQAKEALEWSATGEREAEPSGLFDPNFKGAA